MALASAEGEEGAPPRLATRQAEPLVLVRLHVEVELELLVHLGIVGAARERAAQARESFAQQ